MTHERSCPCCWGVVTVTDTGIAPCPRKLKSPRLLLSLLLVFGVMFFANATSAFGQLHGAGIQKSCTGPVIVCDSDAECSGATGECAQNKCDTSGQHTTSCLIAVTNLDDFGDTIRVNSAFDLISNAGSPPPLRNPAAGNLQIVAVSGATTCTVGGALPCDLQAKFATVTFASSGYNPTAADPDPLPDQGNSQVQDLCNVQPAGCNPAAQNIQFGASSDLVSGCSVENKSDSTACTDSTPGDCKAAGCESGVCVQTHTNVSDSTACTSTPDVEGDCGTPGCEAGVCVANHVHVPDSTACTSTPDVQGDCGTPGCESGVCVATHIPIADSTACSVGVTGTPDECKTPGCEAGVCVANHTNKADSTACTDTTPECGFTAGCEAGSCVQNHTPESCGQGCTPGFWKNNAAKKGGNAWPVPLNTTLAGAGFVIPACLSSCSNFNANTLLTAALALQGGNDACGKAEILLRAAAGAFLNASSSCVSFDLNPTSVTSETNTALASCDPATIVTEATRLDGFNNLGCPINQQGQCTNP